MQAVRSSWLSTIVLALAFALGLGVGRVAAAPVDDWTARLLGGVADDPGPCCGAHRLVDVRLEGVLRLRFARSAEPAAAPVEIRVSPRNDEAPAFARTPSFDVAYAGPGGGPEAAGVARAVAARIAARDPGGLALPTAEVGSGGVPAARSPFDRASVVAAFLLLLVLLALAVPLGVVGGRALVDALGGGRRARFALLALFVVSLGLRAAAPQRLVTYYMGYRAVADAAALEGVPKYGPAAWLPYHLLFQATGPSHVAWVALDQALGALLPLVAALLLALLGAGRLAVAAGGLLLAATPLFVKDAASESLLVPATLWAFTGLAAALLYRESARPWRLLAALAALGLAVLARPEAIVLAPLSVAWLWFLGRTPSRAPLPALLLAAGALLVLAVSRGWQFWGQVQLELAAGNAPQLHAAWSRWVVDVVGQGLWACNAAFWPSLFPLASTALALAAPLLCGAPGRRRALALLGLAAAWFAAARADLPFLSVPRLQVPGLALLTLAAALGLEGGWQRLAPRLPSRGGRLVAVVLALGLVLASALATVPRLWERTNADDEHEAFGEAVARLPEGSITLLARAGTDLPREPGHLHLPEYLLPARGLDAHLRSLDDWRARPDWTRPVYAWLGTRCALRACTEQGEHPACAALRAGFDLEPLLLRRVPVRNPEIPEAFHREDVRHASMQQDLDFPWCAPRGELVLGMYRVVRPSGARPAP